MEKPFNIQFNFPVEGSKQRIPMTAFEEFHSSKTPKSTARSARQTIVTGLS
ncbi:MAG: hypothetical protein Q8926_06850 [Bacteroidota bacterium]|nr:hypothetical protein [Bacteroidota bacterium]